MDYVLRHSFGGDGPSKLPMPVPSSSSSYFPFLGVMKCPVARNFDTRHSTSMDVVCREKDWAVSVCRNGGEVVEEVWSREILVPKNDPSVTWQTIVECMEDCFSLLDSLKWIYIDSDRSLFIFHDAREATTLVDWSCDGDVPMILSFLDGG